MGTIYNNYLNKSINFWGNNNGKGYCQQQDPSKEAGYEVATFNPFYTKQEQSDGLVVMGFNPSGAYPNSLAPRKRLLGLSGNTSAFYEWNSFTNKNKVFDTYTQAVEQFAMDCGYQNNHYKLDAFGILNFQQRVLENHICNNVQLYEPVFGLPISAVVQLNPKVIVFVNGGLRRMLIDMRFFGKFIKVLRWDSSKCAYRIELTDGNNKITCWAVFTTMLSGGHLDKGSREIIVQVIKNL